MLHEISWQMYWTTIIVLSFVYYLSVYLLYFRKEAGVKSNRSIGSPLAMQTNERGSLEAESNHEPTVDELQAQSCLDEINAFFEAQKKSKAVTLELINGLHRIAQKYSSLKGSPFETALSNVMVIQAETICSVHLGVEEIMEVWSD